MSPASNRSPSQLPAVVDPIQRAEQGARLVGALSRKAMTRLAQACLDAAGDTHRQAAVGVAPDE